MKPAASSEVCIKTIYNYLPYFSVQFQELVWAANTCHLRAFILRTGFFIFLLQKQDHVIDHVFRHLSMHKRRVTYAVNAFVHFMSFRKPWGRGYYEMSSLKRLFSFQKCVYIVLCQVPSLSLQFAFCFTQGEV